MLHIFCAVCRVAKIVALMKKSPKTLTTPLAVNILDENLTVDTFSEEKCKAGEYKRIHVEGAYTTC
jgi:GTP cyclohydrolase II